MGVAPEGVKAPPPKGALMVGGASLPLAVVRPTGRRVSHLRSQEPEWGALGASSGGIWWVWGSVSWFG